ncbi:MFS transporter [Paraburkholderia caballeronis]|uniref:MFS transporter n=1 Tax=Paraburkholderia caballeronis TaxID=416943 RepID=UPI001064F67E|nr:MFS transporter [Paraburkholderia caballeronis]TDV07120.1 D-galactonate transporter [Paraburkholderia caballeronis]TDV11264.1 D-galactonate transporter [Paraburkholderia caballeronis]TDV22449.1 D-galactonate transporter [Paraburkholderia caballeronis]
MERRLQAAVADRDRASPMSERSDGTPADAPALYRRIAWRIVPVAVLGYVIAQVDRTNVAFAKLQFLTDLSFSETIYGLGAGLFFAGYFLFEVPSNLLLARIGARLTFTRIMVLWGALSVGMAFVSTPMQFYVMRFLLGAAEAGFFPGIILYFSFWLPSAMRGRATSLFAMGASIAGIVGSPVSGWLMSLDGLHALRGWQLIFIYEGVPAILLGVFCYFYIDDRPDDARWLSAADKRLLRDTLAAEMQPEMQPEATTRRHGSLADAFRDPKVYLLALAYLSILAGTQAVSLWTPTLLKQFGLHATSIGLLAAVPSLVAIVAIFAVGRSSDRRQERRWHFAAAMFAAGASLLLLRAVPSSLAATLALLAIVAGGAWAALAVFWTIPPAYLSPAAKAGGIAFISSAGAVGGFVSPVIVGWSSSVTGSLFAGLGLIGLMLGASALVLLVSVRPAQFAAVSRSRSR